MTTAVTTAGTMPALPAHLRAKLQPAGSKAANALITAGVGSDFTPIARISTEGGRFDIMLPDQPRKTVMTKDSEGNAIKAGGLNVVIVSANAGKYKTYFGDKKWSPGQEGERPLCYSFDGVEPSPLADEPQSPSCQSCRHNAWGSKINELGNETRACGDGKLLAVIPLASVKAKATDFVGMAGAAYQIKVSATALSRSKDAKKAKPLENYSLSEYVAMLNNYPVEGGNVEIPVRSVATRLFFDINAQFPKLQFKLAADPWLTEEDMAYIEMRAQGDDIKMLVTEQGAENAVRKTIGLPAPKDNGFEPPKAIAAPAAAAPAPQVAPTPTAEPPKRRGRPPAAGSPAAAAAAQPAPVPAPEAVAAAEEFFAEAPAPAAAPAVQAAPTPSPAKPTTVDQDKALADISNLFG